MRNLADAYLEILNGARIEDTGLDPNSMKKLELFTLYGVSSTFPTKHPLSKNWVF